MQYLLGVLGKPILFDGVYDNGIIKRYFGESGE